MAGETWVLVEQWRGRISETTFEALALGREVAASLGGSLPAVLLGSGVGELVPALGAAGGGRGGRPRAARMKLPFVNFCRDVQVAEGRLVARCVLYGGKVEATVAPQATPAVLGILPGSRPPEQGKVERAPAVVTPVTLDLPAEPPVRFQGYTDPPPGDVDIARENVLVAVGRGVQRPEKGALAEELAGTLGGAVCGSRPVIDQGWLPASRQVGTSGMIVKPALYLALGISGAPEHVEGMKHAALIIAVNTDPRAPIFNVADYGAVTDALEGLPALTDAVRNRKKAA